MHNNMASSPFDPRMSLFIPRVFREHASSGYISTAMTRCGVGQVARVDLVDQTPKGLNHFQAFVHFATWYASENAVALQARIVDPFTTAKLVHASASSTDPQSYWILNRCDNPGRPGCRAARSGDDPLVQALLDLAGKQAAEIHARRSMPNNSRERGVGRDSARPGGPGDSRPEVTFVKLPKLTCVAGLSLEWLALSDEEKRRILDAELDVEHALRSRILRENRIPEALAAQAAASQLPDEGESAGLCLGCKTGADADAAHRQRDQRYYTGGQSPEVDPWRMDSDDDPPFAR